MMKIKALVEKYSVGEELEHLRGRKRGTENRGWL